MPASSDTGVRRRLAFGLGILVALIAPPLASRAEQSCDFEHRCFETGSSPRQTYHMDPNNPDRETPPPAPQYPAAAGQGRDIVVQPDGSGCRLFRMRSVPNIEPLIIELCAIPPDEERAIRSRASGAASPGADPSAQ
jgi:hypothetical protein